MVVVEDGPASTSSSRTRHTRVLEIVGNTIRVKGKEVAFGERHRLSNIKLIYQ